MGIQMIELKYKVSMLPVDYKKPSGQTGIEMKYVLLRKVSDGIYIRVFESFDEEFIQDLCHSLNMSHEHA